MKTKTLNHAQKLLRWKVKYVLVALDWCINVVEPGHKFTEFKSDYQGLIYDKFKDVNITKNSAPYQKVMIALELIKKLKFLDCVDEEGIEDKAKINLYEHFFPGISERYKNLKNNKNKFEETKSNLEKTFNRGRPKDLPDIIKFEIYNFLVNFETTSDKNTLHKLIYEDKFTSECVKYFCNDIEETVDYVENLFGFYRGNQTNDSNWARNLKRSYKNYFNTIPNSEQWGGIHNKLFWVPEEIRTPYLNKLFWGSEKIQFKFIKEIIKFLKSKNFYH